MGTDKGAEQTPEQILVGIARCLFEEGVKEELGSPEWREQITFGIEQTMAILDSRLEN